MGRKEVSKSKWKSTAFLLAVQNLEKKLCYGFQKWCRVQSRRSLHYLAVLEARFFCSRSCLLSTSMCSFLSRRASIKMYLIVSSPPSPLTLPVMLPPSCLTYVTLVHVIRNNCAQCITHTYIWRYLFLHESVQ